MYAKPLFAAVLAAVAAQAAAQQPGIAAIRFEPATARVGQEVRITVSADGDVAFCGMVVHFDDGSESRQVKIDGKESKFPVTVAKVYAKPGRYSVKAEGRKVTTHLPCTGVAQATLTVEAAPAAPPAAAAAGAPSCPDGWKLKGKPGKAGDFNCSAGKGAKAPDKVLPCAEGLEYFQTKAALGCRKPKK